MNPTRSALYAQLRRRPLAVRNRLARPLCLFAVGLALAAVASLPPEVSAAFIQNHR